MPAGMPDEDGVDEMPATGRAPCGDTFGAPEATYVTDADADVIGEATEA